MNNSVGCNEVTKSSRVTVANTCILCLDCATTYSIAAIIWKLAGNFYNHMLLYVLMNITSCSNLGTHWLLIPNEALSHIMMCINWNQHYIRAYYHFALIAACALLNMSTRYTFRMQGAS